MKKINIELHRLYFKFLIVSTDCLLANRERRTEKEGVRENSGLTECRGRA